MYFQKKRKKKQLNCIYGGEKNDVFSALVSFHGITLKFNEMNRVGKFKLLKPLPCAKRIPCPPT